MLINNWSSYEGKGTLEYKLYWSPKFSKYSLIWLPRKRKEFNLIAQSRSFRTFEPIIFIWRRGNFVFHNYGSYPLLKKIVRVLNILLNLKLVYLSHDLIKLITGIMNKGRSPHNRLSILLQESECQVEAGGSCQRAGHTNQGVVQHDALERKGFKKLIH